MFTKIFTSSLENEPEMLRFFTSRRIRGMLLSILEKSHNQIQIFHA